MALKLLIAVRVWLVRVEFRIMSKKKKILFFSATSVVLVFLGLLGTVLYLQSRPESSFAQFLQRHGIEVEAIVSQPQLSAASQKLGNLIPGIHAKARIVTDQPQKKITSPAAFNAVTIKGVIGSATESTALISTDGRTQSVKVGDQFSVKTPQGNVVLRCEEVRSGLVVLSIVNSDLRKEYALR